MSDAVTSPDADKKPDQSADQSASTKDAEPTKSNAGASDAQTKKKDSSNPADK